MLASRNAARGRARKERTHSLPLSSLMPVLLYLYTHMAAVTFSSRSSEFMSSHEPSRVTPERERERHSNRRRISAESGDDDSCYSIQTTNVHKHDCISRCSIRISINMTHA